MTPIERADELYRAIKSRGLELRRGEGRDDVLYDELRDSLGCPDDGRKLQDFLDASDLTAETFLRAFLKLVAPFAAMFQDIWDYLGEHHAPTATESISVRFGFEDPVDIDLDQFREISQSARRVLASVDAEVWTEDTLRALFLVGRVLRPLRASGDGPYAKRGRYSPGEPYPLPEVQMGQHPFDRAVGRVRAAFQTIIDDAVQERSGQDARRLSDGAERGTDDLQRSKGSIWLTDLLPTWYPVFVDLDEFEAPAKDEALRVFREEVEPCIEAEAVQRVVDVHELLDILNLPFWKHRWHTYEVWATVQALKALDAFQPVLRVEQGHLPIDGHGSAVVADLTTHRHPGACVAVQVQTPHVRPGRTAIRPDLRVCFADPDEGGETAAVVEFKQQHSPSKTGFESIAVDYTDGCPKSGGTVIANYDEPGLALSLPPGAVYVEGVRPNQEDAVRQFQEAILAALGDAGFAPPASPTTVLFDVSLSMRGCYDSPRTQSILKMIKEAPHVTVLQFADGLVDEQNLPTDPLDRLVARFSSTNLDRALRELEHRSGLPARLLVVTDGGYSHARPDHWFGRIDDVQEVHPEDLEDALDWLGIGQD